MGIYNIKILVCFYKEKLLLPGNPIYLNLQCGKDNSTVDLGITGDNTGDNISSRNRYWSEITGLYWAWKNMDQVDYVGLCSYRRFFNFKQNPLSAIKTIPIKSIGKVNDVELPDFRDIFANYDVIIPKPYTYAYSIKEVCERNYRNEDFCKLEEIIHSLSPEFDEAYRAVIYDTNKMIGHNMFVMSWDNFNEYCEWVFGILFELEKITSPDDYPIQQVRLYGYMHELLLGVFIEKKKFKKYYSQLIWATDNTTGFKFNNVLYKIAAFVHYNFKKRWY